MSSAGSLIIIHVHNNLEVLNELSETNGQLYYKGKPINKTLEVSKDERNLIELLNDGIFVNGDFIKDINKAIEDQKKDMEDLNKSFDDFKEQVGDIGQQGIEDLKEEIEQIKKTQSGNDIDYYFTYGNKEEQVLNIDTNGINVLGYLQDNVQTNMEGGDGYITLRANQQYSVKVCLSIDYYSSDNINDVQYKLVDSNGKTYGSIGYTSVDYTDSSLEAVIHEETDVKLTVVAFNEIKGTVRFHPFLSWIKVQEIAQAVTIIQGVEEEDVDIEKLIQETLEILNTN